MLTVGDKLAVHNPNNGGSLLVGLKKECMISLGSTTISCFCTPHAACEEFYVLLAEGIAWSESKIFMTLRGVRIFCAISSSGKERPPRAGQMFGLWPSRQSLKKFYLRTARKKTE